MGNFVVAYLSVNNQDFSGINTMLQIRNVPFSITISGIVYSATLPNEGANVTVQANENGAYFRPNVKSSSFSNPTASGVTSIILFGSK